MPYIESTRRTQLIEEIDIPQTSGELNYLITEQCTDYLQNHGTAYRTLNDIVGALECAKQEFIRRIVNPYEDSRIEANGDVYT